MLGFFIKEYPRPLTRTELVKLVYLFDYQYYLLFNRTYSGVSFVRDHYGPYAQDIITELKDMEAANLILIEKQISSDITAYYHSAQPCLRASLGQSEEYIARKMISKTTNLTLNELKTITYNTPPMRHILEREEELGKELMGEAIDMSVGKRGVKKIPIKKLREAFKTIKFERKGSDEDYARVTNREYESLRGFRERAEKCKI